MSIDNRRQELNNFFTSVQHRALKQAEFATGDRDEAMDLLQDAMIRLARNYADQPEDWAKLFQRILQNLIRDWYRKQKVRSIIVWWQQKDQDGNSEEDVVGQQMDDAGQGNLMAPEKGQSQHQIAQRIGDAIKQLPFRQQQAFTLRAWWGHDIQETAFAMGCSEGSVKTHYSRAIKRLRELLGDFEL